MNRELVFGAAGAAVATGYYWLAASIPDSALADTVGPQGLPIAYAAVLLLLSIALVVRSLRAPRAEPVSRPFRVGRVAGMLAVGVVYVVLVPWLGYIVTLASLLLAVTWYLGGIMKRAIAVVAISGAVLFWLLFVRLLGIPHPAGVWARFF